LDLVHASQKKHVSAIIKWKMVFLFEIFENTLNDNCLPWEVTHVCQIWSHFNKACHVYGPDLAHLAGKTWAMYLVGHLWEGNRQMFHDGHVSYF
jgi:hypothetical protein